jgi:hypothetical protein
MSEEGSWPHNSPTDKWQQHVDLGTKSLFYFLADFDELVACGCTADALELTCSLQLDLLPATTTPRTDAVGSNVDANTAPQLSFVATLTVNFDDETYATMSGISVDNVINLVELEATITVGSTMSLYTDGFLEPLITPVFTARTDFFNVQQSLNTNVESFDMALERLWFAQGPTRDSGIELLISKTNEAYINVDNPAQAGRFRSRFNVPFIMNCKPCYMHFVSKLSPAAKKKSDEVPDEKAGSSTLVFLSSDAAKFDAAASTASNVVVGAVAALVAWRM